MPTFKDAYKTTIGSYSVTKPIENAIKEAIIRDGVSNYSMGVGEINGITPFFLTGYFPSESEIPLFTHPISIFNFQNKNYLCTDMRLYVRGSDSPNIEEKNIKNKTEFVFNKSRAVLSLKWLAEGPASIKNGLQFAGTVFASWLSETISKAYALDFKDQTILAIVTSYYYQSLFYEESVFDDNIKEKMAIHTIKSTMAPSQLVLDIFDKMPKIESLDDYCVAAIAAVENVRLKNFNVPMLLTMVRNSWYGTNSKDVISVALEHPPTWIAIVFAALNERTYRSSAVYRVAERLGKRGNADEFAKAYATIVTQCVAQEAIDPGIQIPAFD